MNKKRFVKKLYGLGFSSFNGFSGCSEKEFLNTLRKIELPAGMSYENAFSTLKNLATPTRLEPDGNRPKRPTGRRGKPQEVTEMKRRIPYWLYKTGYDQFPASDYDKATKTIEVDMPPMKRRVWPKEWKRPGYNQFVTEKGVEVYFWNSGIQQNYLVREPYKRFGRRERTIHAGFDAFDRVMQTVAEYEGDAV